MVHTPMLRMILNINWKQHITNEELYGDLPKISKVVRERRLQFAGHCVRHEEEMASKMILWEPQHGQASRGRPSTTYIDALKDDTGLKCCKEIKTVMLDRLMWRGFVKQARVRTRPK